MGNSKNKKVPKKRKPSNTSSDQKENVPKTKKARNNEPEPDDGIAMSKQLLLKKKNKVRTLRVSSSKPERICANGKPIPSLSELEKMFEDSDDDDETPEKPPCASSTPKKGTSTSNSQNSLLSPTSINKITERLLGSIQEQKLPDPSEVLEATALLREKSPPPPPIIPPKKKKKTEIPYIVGCKDRPKVIRKPNTNFCKGDDDFGVEASIEDPEEPKAAKRRKKSQIPNYSKSIFNAHCDEIAERLAKDDTANLSDASSDSNKTIEYEPIIIQNPQPRRSFSPLPSTSRDSETIEKNDNLFNETLKANQIFQGLPKKNDEQTDNIFEEINITKEITTKEKDEQMNDASIANKRKDGINISKKSSPIKTGNDDVQILDIPYDTIVIDDFCERTVRNTDSIIINSVIEIIEPAGLEVAKPKVKPEIPNDEDCMIVPNSGTNNNYSNYKLDEPIVIDDDYSSINTQFDSFKHEPIEIIDIDEIIAENNTIIDKWKNSQELNKKTTYRNVTAVQTTVKPVTVQTTLPPSTTSTLQASVSSSNTLQASVPPSNTLQASLIPGMTPHASVPPTNTLQVSVPPTNTLHSHKTPPTSLQARATPATIQQANLASNTAVPSNSRNRSLDSIVFRGILNDFFTVLNTMHSESIYDGEGTTANMLTPMTNSIRKKPCKSNSRTTITNVQPASSAPQRNIDAPTVPQRNIDASPVPQRNIGECPICLEPLNSSNGIASTICGHVFCLKCIQASMKMNGRKCPTCRKTLKGVGYHQLYL